jgi:uncharacterized protein GlcG (DUF336 family)
MGAPVCDVNQADAQCILAAALAAAGALGVAVTVAVCDPGGHAKALCRMDGAAFHSVTFALDKAATAAGFGVSTDQWAARIGSRPHILQGLTGRMGFIPIGGGVPLHRAGRLIGAVGISGATEEQDGQIAQAAAAALD